MSLKEEKGFKVGPKGLEERITPKTKAIILNFPNNPMRAIMIKEELEPLA